MADQDARKQPDAQSGASETGARQSGARQPSPDHDPKHAPSAAGADAYNAGNRTGNPVHSGTPGTGETSPGVNNEKPVPSREKD